MRKTVFFLFMALLLMIPDAQGEDNLEKAVTRGEFVMALWAEMGSVPWALDDSFRDLDGADCAEAVSWGLSEGIVRGTGDGFFSPDRGITREEGAAMLRRLWARLDRDIFLPDGLADCNDGEDISFWADDSLYWAVDAGILSWSPGGRLDPAGHVTRGQLVQLRQWVRQGTPE